MYELSAYQVYVRPWIRIPVVLLISFYAFMLCGNLTTYRILAWQRMRAAEAIRCAKQFNPNTNNTKIEQQTNTTVSMIAFASAADDQLVVLLSLASRDRLSASCVAASIGALSDLARGVPGVTPTPTYLSSEYRAWQGMVDLQPLFWPILLVAAIFWQRDFVRLAEVIALECWILTGNGIAHILTVVPDAGGFHPTCHNDRLASPGWWIFTRVSSEFCGDMVWSGHTFHTLFAMIMIYRIMKHEQAKAVEMAPSALTVGSSNPEQCTRYSTSVALTQACGSIHAHVTFVTFLVISFLLEAFGIVKIQYHYSLDIFLGAFITILATTSNWMITTVRFLYRPHIQAEIQAIDAEQVGKGGSRAGAQLAERSRAGMFLVEAPPDEVTMPIEIRAAVVGEMKHTAEFISQDRPRLLDSTASETGLQTQALEPRHALPQVSTAVRQLLRNSDRVIKYMSFPTRSAFEQRLSFIGYH